MRLIGGAALCTSALVIGASTALATGASGPRFGVYTANVAIAGAGHLEGSIHINDPISTMEVTFACGRPTGRDSVTEVVSTPAIPLRGGSFSFVRTVVVQRITTVTENNAPVSHSSYRAAVNVNGAFTAHGQFAGTVQIGGSPCHGTSYTAPRLPGPALVP